jgi:viroplasmin and RNaseH domain-containing protein
MLQEANDQHAGQIKHLESGESEYSISYPSGDYDEEPMGQKFRQYTNFVSVWELKFLHAISDGRIMTALIQDAKVVEAPIQDTKTVEPERFLQRR